MKYGEQRCAARRSPNGTRSPPLPARSTTSSRGTARKSLMARPASSVAAEGSTDRPSRPTPRPLSVRPPSTERHRLDGRAATKVDQRRQLEASEIGRWINGNGQRRDEPTRCTPLPAYKSRGEFSVTCSRGPMLDHTGSPSRFGTIAEFLDGLLKKCDLDASWCRLGRSWGLPREHHHLPSRDVHSPKFSIIQASSR